MKLTSKNIAIKVLKAKGCLSDTVKRMREYIEEGDIEKANCARMNALKLASWIDALGRWNPTIESGNMITITATRTSGAFTYPNIIEEASVNGIIVSPQFSILSGTTNDVLNEYAHHLNCFYSGNDDTLISSASVNEETLTLTFKSPSASAFVFDDGAIFSSGVTFSFEIGDVTAFTDNPVCLTNEETVSIVGKIDELCECNC
jgi:hypothetical protein